MPTPQEQITQVLADLSRGDRPDAGDALLPLLYDELRALARRRLAAEPPGATLDATALVHEVWLRLVGDADPGWNGRRHFFGAAALAMRRILVERARNRGARKRGGDFEQIELSESVAFAEGRPLDLLALDEALERLGAEHPRQREVVMLRHFAGLELTEVATLLELSPATIKSDWSFARAWLHRELSRGEGGARTGSVGGER